MTVSLCYTGANRVSILALIIVYVYLMMRVTMPVATVRPPSLMVMR